ncbi:unnamed protein product [Euphydryas editha]|uniref:TIR domain-containing protein n=1 Tax=Euphydryas editha TaxID=104508 RepID=A0AAU9TBR7_EUPED|nr:unnamed protein product [Euphydryas editha]
MLVWVVLLLVAMAAADVHMDIQDMASYWGGPEEGCSEEIGAGCIILSCTLPSGNLTVYVNRPASYLHITCEKNSTLVCDELQEAKPYIDKYIETDQTNKNLSFLTVETCNLSRESLACPLRVVGAIGTTLVKLDGVVGNLEAVHLEGLNGVTKFRMYDVDENTTSVPYSALSLLPNLKSFIMKKAFLDLKSEPSDILSELTTLELAQGRIKSIPKGAFKNTPEIQTLLLFDNKIEYLHVDAFEGLTKLVNLSLNKNLISHLPGGLFKHTPNIGRLDLYANKLLGLSDDLFTGLQKLEQIFIFDNNAPLKLENQTFSNLPSLYNLKLYRSFIEHIPAELFVNTTNLKTLSLQGNNITYLPNNIFKSVKLNDLNLSHNNIGYLYSDVFLEQSSMTELKLGNNDLKSLPVGLFSNMNSLKVLDLGYNSIGYLNKSTFNGLVSLTELLLTRNRIEQLDQAIFDFTTSLEVLDLSMNNLTISKDRNILKFIEPSLTYILDDNEAAPPMISYYSPMKNLAKLRSLDLSHNHISIICEDWTKMYSLTKLDLSYNNISALSVVDFDFPTDAVIDLQHNNIQQFEPRINSLYTTNATFLMDYNPYRCDCNLYYFIVNSRSGAKMSKIEIQNAECAQPAALKGVKLVDLEPERLTCDVDCSTGAITTTPNNDYNCDSCILNPVKLRLEMFCENLPKVYPKLPQRINSTYIKLKHVTNVPVLPPEVNIIDFSSLNLTKPPLANSIELNLTNNYLTEAPLELFKRNCTVYLSNNPFDCTCGGIDNVVALDTFKTLIPDYSNVTCSNGIFVSNIVIDQLCAMRNGAIISASLGLIGIVIVIITVISFKYTTELRIILRKLGLWRREVARGELYDAFISYAHPDEDFVRNKLIPKLENGRPALKICVHYRDWVVGDYIPEQIARSVDQSRYTIIVLTRNFVNSMWGRMEFRTAHARDRVILLMLEDLSADKSLDQELRAYISMNTYVKADDPLVWDRLRDAVLKRETWGSKPDKPTSKALDVLLENGQLVNKATTAPSV